MSQIYLDKHSPNSGESYVDHYIRYTNVASSLDPPLPDMECLFALTTHYEPEVQQGLLCETLNNMFWVIYLRYKG